jgi:hypothetical protein
MSCFTPIASPQFIDVLKRRNAHERDKFLHFEEKWHKYTITNDANSKYMSVTKWNHSHFPVFNADLVIRKMMAGKNWNENNKYWGMTPAQIKKLWNDNGATASGAGTKLHLDIECFMNQYLVDENDNLVVTDHEMLIESYNEDKEAGDCVINNDTVEWGYFMGFVAEQCADKTPYRTEWMVYDKELKLAGSMDMVYENEDGTLDIYDWKRAKEIAFSNNFREKAITDCINHVEHTNFWHYSLQLNTYKYILERNYGKTVRNMRLVVLHPDSDSKTYEVIDCADMASEMDNLMDLRRSML